MDRIGLDLSSEVRKDAVDAAYGSGPDVISA
jgi:hypothetical protein